MKAETITALAEKLWAASTQDEQKKGVHYWAMTLVELKKQQSPPITAADLARLVDLRLREGTPQGKVPATAMVEEIEATLDLVEACQVMLVERQERWQATVSGIRQAITNDDNPSEKVKGIRTATYPMKFEAGLIRMGVPEKRRDEWYWSFFKDKYSLWEWVESGVSKYDLSGSPVLRDIPEDEIKAAYEQRKAEGWRDAWLLENVAGQWCLWYELHKHDGQRKGGKEGAKSRAKKKAQSARAVQKSRR